MRISDAQAVTGAGNEDLGARSCEECILLYEHVRN